MIPFLKTSLVPRPVGVLIMDMGSQTSLGCHNCSHRSSPPKLVTSLAVPVLPWKPGCPLAAQPGCLASPAASRGAAGGWREAAAPLLGAGPMPAPLTAFPLSFFTLGLTGVYGFGGPYGETVATGAYRAFRVAAAAGHSGAFSGNDSNRTSKFQGGNYTQNPFLRASGNGFLHFTVWSEAFLLPAVSSSLSELSSPARAAAVPSAPRSHRGPRHQLSRLETLLQTQDSPKTQREPLSPVLPNASLISWTWLECINSYFVKFGGSWQKQAPVERADFGVSADPFFAGIIVSVDTGVRLTYPPVCPLLISSTRRDNGNLLIPIPRSGWNFSIYLAVLSGLWAFILRANIPLMLPCVNNLAPVNNVRLKLKVLYRDVWTFLNVISNLVFSILMFED